MQHSKPHSSANDEKVPDELISACVFDYIPGRAHTTFKQIQPNISVTIHKHKLMDTIQRKKNILAVMTDTKCNSSRVSSLIHVYNIRALSSCIFMTAL